MLTEEVQKRYFIPVREVATSLDIKGEIKDVSYNKKDQILIPVMETHRVERGL